MGLRCLLGHDFGPSGVVREHEEDGSEVIVTERELRRCRRCGEEQVLSESTEVRAIRSEADVGMDRRDADAVAPASDTEGVVDPDASESTPLTETSPSSDGGDPAAAAAPAAAVGGAAEQTGDSGDASAESNTSLIDRAEAGFDESSDPGSEDAVILDEADEREERQHGEWPDSDDVDGTAGPVTADGADEDDSADVTDVTDGSEGVPAEADDDPDQSLAETAAEEDAELLDSGGSGAGDEDEATRPTDADGDPSTDGGEWPDHDGEDEGFDADQATAGGPDIEYGNSIAPESTNGKSHDAHAVDGYETSYLDNTVEERDGDGTIVSAGDEDVSGRAPGVETEYYCPNCDHARPLDSSLRPGDICPECQRGYISERER